MTSNHGVNQGWLQAKSSVETAKWCVSLWEYFEQQAKTWPFFEDFFEETFIGWRGFSLKMYGPFVFAIHQLPFPFTFTHDGAFMYYCSCLHNWRWWRAWNKWLASPQTTHQRLALKQLPHRKCMAKLWNISPTLNVFDVSAQRKCTIVFLVFHIQLWTLT